MRLPKIYKPVIKTKQVSHSETLFPNLYKKKKIVYDDFSKIYLTNMKDLKSEGENEFLTPRMTIGNNKRENETYNKEFINFEKDQERSTKDKEKDKDKERLNNLKYLNHTLISKEQCESSNNTSMNLFARDTINNRFMYSLKSNQSRKSTPSYNKSISMNSSVKNSIGTNTNNNNFVK